MLWPAIFWSTFAFGLFSNLLYRVLIPIQFEIFPDSARMMWSFVYNTDHPARFAITGFVEVFVGWLCFWHFRRNGLEHAIFRLGRLDQRAIGMTIAGALFLPDLTYSLLAPLLEAIGIDTSTSYRDGESGLIPRQQLLGFFLVGIIIAPVIEEYLYRGAFMTTALAARWHPLLVLFASSAGFTFIHMQYNVMGLLFIFLMGCGFGWLRLWSGGLGLPMIAHAVINLKVFIISLAVGS